ncbi:MAG: hypothetical protein V1758_05555 [Pseudomonadota bacterium]
MKSLILFAVLSLIISSPCSAEDFLGAPIMPDGQTLKSGKGKMEKVYDIPATQILSFYKEKLKDNKDIKYRELGNQINIEEYGNAAWHKIVLSENAKGQTSFVIVKDNWTWIIGTLTIRFTGVFVVLLVLYLAMNIATGIIARSVGRLEAGKTKAA